MTYEEFYKVIEDTYSELYPTTKYTNGKSYRSWFNGNTQVYFVKWRTGGASGGNCWGDSASYSGDAEDEPTTDLEELFDKLCPQITFKQHRLIMKEVIERTNDTDYEYYGNFTEYCCKTIEYRKLYHALVKHNIIDDD